MAGTSFSLLVLVLVSSHLIFLNAVPITRTRSLMHESQGLELSDNTDNTHLANTEKSWEVQTIIGRMDVEVNDYPGSGANNRHTPKPPLPWKNCADC